MLDIALAEEKAYRKELCWVESLEFVQAEKKVYRKEIYLVEK